MYPDGMRRENNTKALGEIQVTHGDIKVAQWKHGSIRTKIKIDGIEPCIHISLGWMDDRAWY